MWAALEKRLGKWAFSQTNADGRRLDWVLSAFICFHLRLIFLFIMCERLSLYCGLPRGNVEISAPEAQKLMPLRRIENEEVFTTALNLTFSPGRRNSQRTRLVLWRAVRQIQSRVLQRGGGRFLGALASRRRVPVFGFRLAGGTPALPGGSW
jgi:hypothetical protein